jgi:hypothetical protein
MKLITILKNNIPNTDLVVYFKDNHPHDYDEPPTPPRNTAAVTHTKSGVPVLQVEFWTNEAFRPYRFFSEPISYVGEDDTEFDKHGCRWLEFLEIYDSF